MRCPGLVCGRNLDRRKIIRENTYYSGKIALRSLIGPGRLDTIQISSCDKEAEVNYGSLLYDKIRAGHATIF